MTHTLTASLSETHTQFIPLQFAFIDSPLFGEWTPGSQQLYWLLRRYVCRAAKGHTLSKVYNEGWLAAEGWQSQWGKRLHVHQSTISRRLNELVKLDLAQVFTQSDSGKNRNVIILGQWHQVESVRIEVFFLDVTVAELSTTHAQVHKTHAGVHKTHAQVHTSNREETIEKIPNKLPLSAKKRKRAPPDPRIPPLLEACAEARDYPTQNYGREAAAAKRLLKDYTPQQIVACLKYMLTQDYWKDKPLSLQSVANQIGPWSKNHASSKGDELDAYTRQLEASTVE